MESSPPNAKVTVTIANPMGLHARPAMAFVDVANTFASDVRVRKGANTVDGKSIMQMMTLDATQGTQLLVEAVGADAEEAIAAIRGLVERNFDETE